MTTEHGEQVALFEWIDRMEVAYPLLGLAFAIPNGGYRHITTAKKLKAEGVRAGVPDICIPISNKKHHSLWIELKATKNGKVSDLQMHWIDKLNKHGNLAIVCFGCDDAIKSISEYLGIST